MVQSARADSGRKGPGGTEIAPSTTGLKEPECDSTSVRLPHPDQMTPAAVAAEVAALLARGMACMARQRQSSPERERSASSSLSGLHHDVTRTAILRALRGGGTCTPRELVALCGCSKSKLIRTLNTLVQSGIISAAGATRDRVYTLRERHGANAA